MKKWKLSEHIINECTGESDGMYSVRVENVDVPFTIIFNGIEVNALRHEFSFLSSGIYELNLRDADGCQLDKIVAIEEHECIDFDVIVDVQNGIYWSYPIPDSESHTVIIRNVAGQVVFEQEVYEGETWEGVNNEGNTLPMGVYFYQFVGLPDVIGSVTIH